jgi:hypothetical protein
VLKFAYRLVFESEPVMASDSCKSREAFLIMAVAETRS